MRLLASPSTGAFLAIYTIGAEVMPLGTAKAAKDVQWDNKARNYSHHGGHKALSVIQVGALSSLRDTEGCTSMVVLSEVTWTHLQPLKVERARYYENWQLAKLPGAPGNPR
ncbi:hypothetical protein CNMCM5623_003376 [Aspergillus felis]|uniref:Uncharacterized protein n=1 Tax=Aspergillus felis TaxID=1287682 RepID=A0A8H6V0I2_9EURO|nr:hypothetical protein CNMCM5623_003376 [Aspergillus felis]KAF7183404.1 hypothetical protein CNMCM7691_003603 [Aspergillus felis]